MGCFYPQAKCFILFMQIQSSLCLFSVQKMAFHYLMEVICRRSLSAQAFVCTHAVGGGRDKRLSFLTYCLVTLSGYDRARTRSSSFSSLLYPLYVFTLENDRNCTLCRGRGRRNRENGGGGMGEVWGHTCSHKTQPRVTGSLLA